MRITYDPIKRRKILVERGLDFEDASKVFAGRHLTDYDDRDYDEDRWITTGMLYDDVIVLVWTERGNSRRIISMRRAEEYEQGAYYEQLDRPG